VKLSVVYPPEVALVGEHAVEVGVIVCVALVKPEEL
jgi:hypothetical protein